MGVRAGYLTYGIVRLMGLQCRHVRHLNLHKLRLPSPTRMCLSFGCLCGTKLWQVTNTDTTSSWPQHLILMVPTSSGPSPTSSSSTTTVQSGRCLFIDGIIIVRILSSICVQFVSDSVDFVIDLSGRIVYVVLYFGSHE